jgi:hypothetical protein
VIPGSRFDVVTPTATAGALGTEFRIQINEAGTGLLYVTESTVYVSTLDQNVTVSTGYTHPLTGDGDSGNGYPGSGNAGSGDPGSGSSGGSDRRIRNRRLQCCSN